MATLYIQSFGQTSDASWHKWGKVCIWSMLLNPGLNPLKAQGLLSLSAWFIGVLLKVASEHSGPAGETISTASG